MHRRGNGENAFSTVIGTEADLAAAALALVDEGSDTSRSSEMARRQRGYRSAPHLRGRPCEV